jgi:hypothetical protein
LSRLCEIAYLLFWGDFRRCWMIISLIIATYLQIMCVVEQANLWTYSIGVSKLYTVGLFLLEDCEKTFIQKDTLGNIRGIEWYWHFHSALFPGIRKSLQCSLNTVTTFSIFRFGWYLYLDRKLFPQSLRIGLIYCSYLVKGGITLRVFVS